MTRENALQENDPKNRFYGGWNCVGCVKSIFGRKWPFSVFGKILISRFLSLIGILNKKIPIQNYKIEIFRRKWLFLIPCVWQDGALSVSSSHTWLHLDQRGRNKTSNQIGISLKIFLWNFFAFFENFEMKNFFIEHSNMELGYLSVPCIWSNSYSLCFLVMKMTKFQKNF